MDSTAFSALMQSRLNIWSCGTQIWQECRGLEIKARFWPPSMNATWRNVRGQTLLSRKSKTFRMAVQSVIAAQRAKGMLPREPLTNPLAVALILYPPNAGKRDLDNYQKSLFDALTISRVWQDDSLVKLIASGWGEPVRGGAFRIGIVEIPSKILPLLSYED